MDRAADAIRMALRGDFPDLVVVVEGRKRSVLVRFRNPVTSGQDDFTADVIIAVDNVAEDGLFIPRFQTWDRADPEEHTRLIRNAIDKTDVLFARVVRLLKHWNRNNGASMCSWNVKALALGCLVEPTTQLAGLREWFDYAAAELRKGATEDPAGVAPKPIKLNEAPTKVVGRLTKAAAHLERAVAFEKGGYSLVAWDELAQMFNDEEMLPYPDQHDVTMEHQRKLADDKAASAKITGTPTLLTGIGAGSLSTRRDVDSWAP